MSDLTLDYRRTNVRQWRTVHQGLDALAFSFSGKFRRRSGITRSLRRTALKVNRRVESLRSLPREEVQVAMDTQRMRARKQGKFSAADLREALALVCVVCEWTLGYRPFVVQIMGALALSRGYLAEMATGEGKTLTLALAAAVAGWTGLPCHVVTANDYLAARDAESLRAYYTACGVSVGCVTGEMQPPDRAQNYRAGVTYSTAKEVLADFLRDRIELGRVQTPARRLLRRLAGEDEDANGRLVMRGLHWAFVDEADSIFIDEAVTPLIISTQAENEALRTASALAAQLVKELRPGVDYDADFKYRDIELRQSAVDRLARHRHKWPEVWRSQERHTEMLRLALLAREFYRLGTHYVVQEGSIELVDEFTGRIMPHRTWQQGLQQAVEAKEGIEISLPNETMASMSFQRFFRCYPCLGAVTGTGFEAAEEFWQIYHLAAVRIPTNRPCIRKMAPTQYFRTMEQKWIAVIAAVRRLHETGCPVLIGTRSVSASEELSERLAACGFDHRVLNAARHQAEAEIVREAGRNGQITVATNMAGRGTDIALGDGVAERGGLHVIATEMHESPRIDRQLYGRSARQGDAGSAQLFVSLEDDLFTRFVPKAFVRTLRASFPNKGACRSWSAAFWFRHAQRLAQRLAFHQRKQVLRMDRWLDEHLFSSINTESNKDGV